MAAIFKFSDGRWAKLGPPSSAFLLWFHTMRKEDDLPDTPEFADEREKRGWERLTEVVDHLRRNTIEVSWPSGDIGDLSPKEHMDLTATWLASGRDDALPPVNGATSRSPSPPRKRAVRTGRRAQ